MPAQTTAARNVVLVRLGTRTVQNAMSGCALCICQARDTVATINSTARSTQQHDQLNSTINPAAHRIAAWMKESNSWASLTAR
jgi:hypothetical protein